jgi:plastocyanin
MRRLALLLAAAALLAFPATVGAAKTYTVKTGDDFFSPTKKTIKVNDIVKWVWVGEDLKPGQTTNEHSIVDSKDRFKSKTQTEGTYRKRFKRAGKYTIFCGEHPETMIFRLTVKR